MSGKQIKQIALGLGMVAVQVMLFRHLKILDMQPDLVLVFLLWYMSRADRTSAILMGALLGLTQDAMMDLWGLNMFSKTFIAFAGHNLLPGGSETRLLLNQVALTVLIAALAHNLVFLGLNWVVDIYSGEFIFWRHWLGSSVYTAALAGFIHLFRTR
ncbi:MAG: rod shape-determining protein MreD [Balneolaceae bacterium]|nr:rod shape-determining protein MreD [Balneolaceae bacterium]